MNEVAIKCSVGLGDIILLSGAVEYLSKYYDIIYVPCRSDNYVSTWFIYRYNDKVIPVSVDVDHGSIDTEYLKGKRVLNAVHSYDRSLSFAENYYRNLDLDYSIRFDYCPIQKACEEFIKGKPEDEFAFVHDDLSRGYRIDPNLIGCDDIVKPSDHYRENFLGYANYITYAEQGHYIDSAFLHFSDSIETKGDLFFHEYARPGSIRRVKGEPFCPSRKQWIVYEQLDECFLGDEDCNIDVSILSDDDVEIARKTVRKNDYFFQNRWRCLENNKRIELINFKQGRRKFRTKFLILGINGKIIRIIPITPQEIDVYQTKIFYNPGDIQA